ncbi:MAG: alpha/beta fold hydrolase [Rhizobacter sp.]|nr:alpha/beta fold hydrolase [Rhizobacter sp.]
MRIDGLAVDVNGSGTPVVLLHGLGGTLSVWEPQAVQLAERFRVVRYDARGSGGSPAETAPTMESWVGDLTRLLDELAIGRAHLVGHSLGTLVLQHLAARFPERVASLSLLGVNRSPPPSRRAAVLQRAEQVRREGVCSIVDALLASGPSAHSRVHAPAAMAAIREMVSRQRDREYAWSCEAMANSNPADLSKLDAPILLVAGAADTISPPQLSRDLGAEQPRARVIELANCGHWMPLEQPDATTQALIAFLAG